LIPKSGQNEEEFKKLLKIYKEKSPKKVLEIGTHEGGTLYYWLSCAKEGTKVGSIDIQRINHNLYDGWCAPGVSIIYLTGSSQEESSIEWARSEFDLIDWLFIDGGHSYECVSSDFYSYLPLMSENGIIMLHDITVKKDYIGNDGTTIFPNEVYILWDEIKNNYKTQEIIEPHDEWVIGPGIGIVYL
jgi:predicted O-methyltransferase YrrM